MAGILANSVSKTMSAGDTSADNVVTNFVAGERITLSTTPTGSAYAWTISAPSGSSAARAALYGDTEASPFFTPDVGGTFLVTCSCDGTNYVLRITTQAAAVSEPAEALRFSPRSDTTIPAPAAGVALYYSSDQNALCVKDASGAVFTVNLTAV